jgi:hypothetical protein
MFLTGWELLKNEIQDGVRQFFVTGFDQQGPDPDPRYARDVLSRHQHPFEASLLWLVDQQALSLTQAARVRELRVHRNEVAHELPKLLVDPAHEVSAELLREMGVVLRALGVFWGRIEVDINPDFDGRDVKDEDIRSGASLLMEHLVSACEDTRQSVTS